MSEGAASATARPAGQDRQATVNEIVSGLVKAVRNMGFYAADHPAVTQIVAQTAGALETYLADRSELVLKFVEGEVVADDRPAREANTAIAHLAGACGRREIESLTLLAGVRPEELQTLVQVLSMEPSELAEAGGAARVLAERGVKGVAVERLREVEQEVGGGALPSSGAPGRTYQTAVDVMRGIMSNARQQSPIGVDSANAMVRDLLDLIVRQQSEMLGLISVKQYDEYTFTHGLHICILSIALGWAVSLDNEALMDLGVSALLHDVGKIRVPLEVLRKPGALSDEEFALVRRHPVDGALILAAQEAVPDAAPVVAFEHHLQPDLRGYPTLSKPRELNLFSLMVGIADVYDALTTQRPYRPPMPPHEALAMMHGGQAGSFEPRLLGRFTELLGRHPPGTLLRLSDGSLAVVSRPSPRDSDHPFARRVVAGEERRTLDPEELELGAEGAPGIEQVLDPRAAGLDVARLLRESPRAQPT